MVVRWVVAAVVGWVVGLARWWLIGNGGFMGLGVVCVVADVVVISGWWVHLVYLVGLLVVSSGGIVM